MGQMDSEFANKKKTCRKCLQVLPATEFHKNSTTKDGLNEYCKPCRSTYRSELRAEKKMNQKKFTTIYNSLNSIAKRTYDLMPDGLEVTPPDLVAKMVSKGSNVAMSVVHGSLANMKKLGIVREVKQGVYIKVAITDRPKLTINPDRGVEIYEKAQEEPSNVITIKQPTPYKTIEELAQESHRPLEERAAEMLAKNGCAILSKQEPIDECLGMIRMMTGMLNHISDTLETIQLAHLEEIDGYKAKLGKLEQLRMLLKDVAV